MASNARARDWAYSPRMKCAEERAIEQDANSCESGAASSSLEMGSPFRQERPRENQGLLVIAGGMQRVNPDDPMPDRPFRIGRCGRRINGPDEFKRQRRLAGLDKINAAADDGLGERSIRCANAAGPDEILESTRSALDVVHLAESHALMRGVIEDRLDHCITPSANQVGRRMEKT